MSLGPGSIAFVGFNADATDNLSFVVLDDIAAGTVINFTDNGWNGTAFGTTENHWSWTAGSDIAAGTVVTMDALATVSPTSNLGTIAYSTANTRDLSTSVESVFAYVGNVSSPTFLAAISNSRFINANTTGVLTGTGLVEGATALDISPIISTADIGAYVGPRTALSVPDLLALINNSANWVGQGTSADNSSDGITPDLPFSTAPFATDPTAQQVGFAADSMTVSHVEGDAGTTTIFTFTVQRVSGTAGEISFAGTMTPGAGFDGADIAGGAYPTSFSGTIADGATTGTVTISVLGDFTKEADESFLLKLTSVTNKAGEPVFLASGQTQATGTVINDDTQAGTPLGAGAIAFVGYNAEGNDNLSFVVLEDIAAGTVINFTDNEWNGSAFTAGESYWSWTASSDIAKGTVVNMDDLSSASPTSNLGTIGYQTTAARDIDLFSDAVYAYVGGATAPTFLTAFSTGEFAFSGGVLTNTGLVLGQTANSLYPGHSGDDIAAYNGPRTGMQTYADFRAAINNSANWISQGTAADESHDGIAPDVPFSTQPFVPNEATQLLGFAPGSVSVSHVEGDAGTSTVYTFTVQRSNGTSGVLSFSGTLTPGTGVDAADFGGTLPLTFSGTIAEGATTGTVSITVSGDITREADETFQLQLTAASNTQGDVLISGETQATGTIVNDDTQSQTISWTADNVFVQEEGAAGTTKTYTFTVVRDSTEGNLTFTAQLQNNFDPAHRVDAADFGGVLPTTLTGTILDGQTTGTVSITVTGDDRLEDLESFGLVLIGGLTDRGMAAVPGGTNNASVTIKNDDFVIHDGESIKATAVLAGGQHLLIENGGRLETGTPIRVTGPNLDVVIDNHGFIGGANKDLGLITVNGDVVGNITFNNHADGELLGSPFFTGKGGSGGQLNNVVVNNDGVIDGGESQVKAQGVVNNSSTGIIRSSVKDGTTLFATLTNNYGVITSGAEDAVAGNVHNFAGGLIQGARHAVTGSVGITVINEAGGTMIGNIGSAVNIDNDSREENRVYVTNSGVMKGGPLGGDGDAIDVDGLLTLDNYGYVGGLGANGYHDGEPNVSEGIAIGGGIINNYAGAGIYGYGRAIQVDNSSNSDAPASVTIYNEGQIYGDGHPPEGVTQAEIAQFVARLTGGEAINIEGSLADTLTNTATGRIIGGVKMGGGNDTLTTSGLMVATGGSAIDLGAGDDTLNVYTGAVINGTIVGGAGNDTINLLGTGFGGTLRTITGFEKIDVQGGTWGIGDTTAAITIRNGASLVVNGSVAGSTVAQGGTEYVYGAVIGSSVSGEQMIGAGASATDTTVDAGGSQTVYGAATATDTTLAGGSQTVWGNADDTTVEDGGFQYVHGSVTDTTVDAGGSQAIYAGGTATGTTVQTGGVQIDWGAAVDTTIDGGAQFVYGTATGTNIVSGIQHIADGAIATGTMIGSGGTEYVHSGGSAHDVTFAGPNAALVLDDYADFTGTISGWQFGDSIDFGNIAFDAAGTSFGYTENADYSGGTLTVTDGVNTATLALLGQYAASDFALSSDGHGGTLLTDPTVAQGQMMLAPAHAA